MHLQYARGGATHCAAVAATRTTADGVKSPEVCCAASATLCADAAGQCMITF